MAKPLCDDFGESLKTMKIKTDELLKLKQQLKETYVWLNYCTLILLNIFLFVTCLNILLSYKLVSFKI